MSAQSIKLKLWIPIVTLIMAFSYLFMITYIAHVSGKANLIKTETENVSQLMNYVKWDIEESLRHRDLTKTRGLLKYLSVNHNLLNAIIIDGNRNIVASNKQGEEGHHVAEKIKHFDLSQAEQTILAGINHTYADLDTGKIYSYSPITLSRSIDEIRPTEIGILFMKHDINTLKTMSMISAVNRTYIFWLLTIPFIILVIFGTQYFIVQPLKRLIEITRQISKGKLNVSTNIEGRGELYKLGNALDYMAKKLLDNKEELQKNASILEHQSKHDSLTDLVNRTEFESRLNHALNTTQKKGIIHSVLYMDLDKFKVVNDTCGHQAGDQVLIDVCNLIRSHCRKRDTLARVGGDELGLLMENCSIDDAVNFTEKILIDLGNYRYVNGDKVFKIGISTGIVEVNASYKDIITILKHADMSCYKAKEQGGNSYNIYNVDDYSMLERDKHMNSLSSIYQALDNDNFILYLQKICPFNKNANEPDHYEVLVRMLDENGEIIPPGSFLPAAERFNLITNIDRWIITNALLFQRQYYEHHNKHITLSINLSGQTISADKSKDYIVDSLDQFKYLASDIWFEITETAVIKNINSATNFIKSLRSNGCKIALDDFGTGLSSYSYLKNFDVDIIKIDGSFVRGIDIDPFDRAIVKSVCDISKTVNAKTVAEFVETDAIKDTCIELGIDYGQGYALGKPFPAKKLLEITSASERRVV